MADPQPRHIRDAISELDRFLSLRDSLTAPGIQAIAPIIQQKIAALPRCSLANWHESNIDTLETLTQLRTKLQALEFDAGSVTEIIHSVIRSMSDEAGAAEPQTAYPGIHFPLVAYRLGPVDGGFLRARSVRQNFISADCIAFDQQRRHYDILAVRKTPLGPYREIAKHLFSINNLAAVQILPLAPIRMHVVMVAGFEDMILQVPDIETAAALSRQMKEGKPGLRADHWT